MKIIVIGSTGFIGTEFCKQALDAGHELFCVGEILTEPEKLAAVPWASADAVVHLGAAGVRFASPDRTWEKCLAVNFLGTQNLLDAIVRAGAMPRIFIAGSVRESEMGMAANLKYWRDPYITCARMTGEFVREWSRWYQGTVIRPLLKRCFDPGQVEQTAEEILRIVA